MPRLVPSPEDIIRKTGQDIYCIIFKKADAFNPEKSIPGKADLLDWFKSTLPETPVQDLAPSEFSGFISGGIGIQIHVQFDEASLATYCAAWEDASGANKDPRWQCFIYTVSEYQRAREKHGDPRENI